MDAAEQLFGSRGVNAVSLREIRLAAGARNTTAVQFHFGDRDGLLQALVDRHMPEIAAIQQVLYDRMIAEDRAGDPRSLVDVLARPSAEYLMRGPRERSWVQIISDLGAQPDLEVPEMLAVAPEPAIRAGRMLYDILVQQMPAAVAGERMIVLAQCAVHICADRARLENDPSFSRKHVSGPDFIENLVDMLVGAVLAPVHATTSPTPGRVIAQVSPNGSPRVTSA